MTSLEIQCFLRVADSMSFSQAAEAMYVSQPAVSRQIKQLEEELGFSLFDRSRRKELSLTPAGMVFRDFFRHMEETFEEAKSAAKTVSSGPALSLQVGIGLGMDFSREIIFFEKEARRRYPAAQLSFESNDFASLHARLQAGQLDAIICTRTSVQNFDHVEIADFGSTQARAYVAKGAFAPANRPLSITDFEGRNLLMLPENEAPMALQIVMLAFQAQRCRVNPVILPNRDTIYQAMLRGEGFSVFDEYITFSMDPRITYFPIPSEIQLSVVWDSRNENPLIRLLAECFRHLLSGRGQ